MPTANLSDIADAPQQPGGRANLNDIASPYSAPSRNVVGGRTWSIPDSDQSHVANFARWLQSRVDSLEQAFQRFREPGFDAKLGAASDVVRNVGAAAAPLALPTAIAAPVRTAAAVVGGAAAGYGAQKAAEALNVPPGTSEAIGTAAGLYGGAKAEGVAGKISDIVGRVVKDPAARKAVIDILPKGDKINKAIDTVGKVTKAAQAPAAGAPAAEDTELLDKLAQGFGVKSFDKLKPQDQETVRGLASRINGQPAQAAPSAAPGSSDTGQGMTPEVLPPERRLGPGAIQMPAAPDTSGIRLVPAGRGLARDPRTGRMFRVYSSTDQPIPPAARPVQTPPVAQPAAPAAAEATGQPQPAETASAPSAKAELERRFQERKNGQASQNNDVSAQPSQNNNVSPAAPSRAAVEKALSTLPNDEPRFGTPRNRDEANQQFQARNSYTKANRMAQLLYYGDNATPTPGFTPIEAARDLIPDRQKFPDGPAGDKAFAQAQEVADAQWEALAKADKTDQLQRKGNGAISQSDLGKIDNVEAPSPDTRRLVLRRLERYWQAHRIAQEQPAAAPKNGANGSARTGMGAMKRYRTDYNPAALTDEQIQALHQ